MVKGGELPYSYHRHLITKNAHIIFQFLSSDNDQYDSQRYRRSGQKNIRTRSKTQFRENGADKEKRSKNSIVYFQL